MRPTPTPEPVAAERAARTRARIFALLEQVPDPEIPVVSIRELGILRDVLVDAGHIEIIITPTYSGCPAMAAIEADILTALRAAGFAGVTVRRVLAPPWSTDWIAPDARDKLRRYGIAPPAPTSAHEAATQSVRITVARAGPAAGASAHGPLCPQCGSARTEVLSAFGSTSCKALYRCLACREPFDYFKPY